MKVKIFLLLCLLSFIVVSLTIFVQSSGNNNGKLDIVVCNVGQGDGIFIKSPSGLNIINDGGPNEAILGCIGRHSSLTSRTISAMLLTHPHADHIIGLIPVLQRYTVKHFYTEDLANPTALYTALINQLSMNQISPTKAYAGDVIRLPDGVQLIFRGPTREFLARTSPNGKIGESREFGSLITQVSFGSFSMLLTGDSQADEMLDAAQHISSQISVLQVPHHGSKTGLTSSILDILKPKLAVISVGKNNRYGHPNKETLGLLSASHIRVLRTDFDGDVEIDTDGKSFEVKTTINGN